MHEEISYSGKEGAGAADEQNFISLPSGIVLGSYKLLRMLGQGGFGITYLAENEENGDRVVIKENLPGAFSYRHPQTYMVGPATSKVASDYNWAMERFIEEAQLLANLNHPNIVKVQKAFQALGTAYYVMPWVGGQELGKCSPAPEEITEQWLLPIVRTLLDALEYLHEQKIFHRDIKPGNILRQEDGRPVLIDFGAARAMVGERSATMIESAGYTPIEQLQSGGRIGPWTDLYALGATCYRLITGTRPPRSVNRMAKTDPYKPLSRRKELTGRFSTAFLKSIDKALRVWEKDRWQSASAWRAALPADNMKPPSETNTGNRQSVLPWCVSLALLTILGVGCWYHYDTTTSLRIRLDWSEQTRNRLANELEAARQKINSLESSWNKTKLELNSLRTEQQIFQNTRRKLKERGIEESEYSSKIIESTGTLDLLNLLIEAGADVNARNSSGRTALCNACWNGHTAAVRRLLAVPAINVNLADNEGETPLIRSVYTKHTDCTRLLLAVPEIDVNKAENDGETPLYWAAYKDNAECMKLLLAAPGINVNKACKNENTPLYQTALRGHDTCMKLLLETPGIDINKCTTNGYTPLSGAASAGNTECIKLLLARPGIDINKADKDNWTPLYWAASGGKTGAVKLLLAAPGININRANKNGETPLKAAERKGHTECARLIREAGGI